MGSVYPRGQVLWLAYVNEAGKRVCQSTGLRIGAEEKAAEVLDIIERRVAASRSLGGEHEPLGPATVRQYAAHWIADRKRRGLSTAVDDESRLRHVLSVLGELPLADVRVRHVRDAVRTLRANCGQAKGQMSPRTLRHVYGALRRMFGDAVTDELVSANPCALKRDDLPKKADKDPTWRSGAVFVREEVEQLISDARIAEDLRVCYAIKFLSGVRDGEAYWLRFRNYDPKTPGLGRLEVAGSYNTKEKTEKGTKTENPRVVPVHPTLAKILATWRLGGFERMTGRPPRPDDLIVPSRTGKHRNTDEMLKKFYADLDRLGMRRRRPYDSRRTFISLCLADGARKDILRWVTHGPEGDIMSVYTTLPWEALCGEVAKLRISLLDGQILRMAKVANLHDSEEGRPMELLQRPLHEKRRAEKRNKTNWLGSDSNRLPADYETDSQGEVSSPSAHLSTHIPLGYQNEGEAEFKPPEPPRSNVADPLFHALEGLRSALKALEDEGDAAARKGQSDGMESVRLQLRKAIAKAEGKP